MTIEEFLEKRFALLQAGDYRAVFATYHTDAPFRRQFQDCAAYLDFAKSHLTAVKVISWSCRGQRELSSGDVECLLVMELECGGQRQFFYELALLKEEDGSWFYHSAQKLTVEDYKGLPEQLDFKHFDLATEKIRF